IRPSDVPKRTADHVSSGIVTSAGTYGLCSGVACASSAMMAMVWRSVARCRRAARRGAQDGNSLHASAADCKPLHLRFGVRRLPPLLFWHVRGAREDSAWRAEAEREPGIASKKTKAA